MTQNKSSETYNQTGPVGIGHMNGGEIKDNVKVAGVYNETNNSNGISQVNADSDSNEAQATIGCDNARQTISEIQTFDVVGTFSDEDSLDTTSEKDQISAPQFKKWRLPWWRFSSVKIKYNGGQQAVIAGDNSNITQILLNNVYYTISNFIQGYEKLPKDDQAEMRDFFAKRLDKNEIDKICNIGQELHRRKEELESDERLKNDQEQPEMSYGNNDKKPSLVGALVFFGAALSLTITVAILQQLKPFQSVNTKSNQFIQPSQTIKNNK